MAHLITWPAHHVRVILGSALLLSLFSLASPSASAAHVPVGSSWVTGRPMVLPAGLAPVLARALRRRAAGTDAGLLDQSSWHQQARLSASDGVANDSFGYSVALSGDTARVGAWGKNSGAGAAYVFVRSGTTWSQQAELTATNGMPLDSFGTSVAISGNIALVAAGADDPSGAVYVFVRNGTTWAQQAELTAGGSARNAAFGNSVALSGDTALIGAPNKSRSRGAAYVFGRHGTTWSQQAQLTANDGFFGDNFGASVALSGTTALVGAPYGNNVGAAYVFVRNGTNWLDRRFPQESGGRSPERSWTQQAKLIARDGVVFDTFGTSVALSGDTALIGAPNQNTATGAAYVFGRHGTTWTLQSKLTATAGVVGDWFGYSVALSGGTALIGAPRTNNDTGAAYVFGHNGKTWSQQAKLTAAAGAVGDWFGFGVVLSAGTALVGAPRTNASTGAVYVFGRL